jgi:DNA gyrase inhibitor GyrI
MDVKLIKHEKDIIIGGISVETNLENTGKDVEALYNDFIHNGKMKLLNGISKNQNEYYGVIWYTKLHEKYRYLIGQKIDEKIENIENKIISKGEYAFSKFPPKYDAIKAWTDFYNEGIPGIGYKPKEENDLAFEYYPNCFDGDYELWALVEKA